MPGILTNAKLAEQRVAYQGLFNRGLKSYVSKAAILATEVQSTTAVQKYGWLGALPKFRKWIGERRYRTVKEKAYSLENEKFTAEMELDEDDWADDNLGQYDAVVTAWGSQGEQFKDEGIVEGLAAGHQRECYDGQNFFDTDHPYEYLDANGNKVVTTASNSTGDNSTAAWFLVDLSQPLKPILYQNRQAPSFWMGTDAAVVEMNGGKVPMHAKARRAVGYTLWQLAHRCTGALNAANYEAAYTAMTSLKDEEGKPLGIRPTHIVFGTANRAAAKTLFEAQNKAGGESNIYYKDVELLDLALLS